ncbi:c-type cytochrome [Flavobacterium maritimum]|jgi:cytochrome c553|uniref:c-type cytochrome n=1 Tax=Flavobacterium maritimum TaxID=3149042 RepID=UPI0032B61745
MKKLKIVCSVLVVALSVMSCSGGGDDSPTPVNPPTTGGGGSTVTNPTYTANIKSIIDGNCISCHGPGGEQSNHPLLTYEEVSSRSTDIKERIGKPAGDPMVMPKGGKLSQTNIDLINKWIANGMPN